MNHAFKDIKGCRYGKLVAVKYSHTNKKLAVWDCKCDCGRKTKVLGTILRRGNKTLYLEALAIGTELYILLSKPNSDKDL